MNLEKKLIKKERIILLFKSRQIVTFILEEVGNNISRHSFSVFAFFRVSLILAVLR